MITPLPPPPGGPPLPPPPGDPPDPSNKRDKRGRFAPGIRPKGKPKGARNKTTIMLEKLFEGEAKKIGRVAVDVAKSGDVQAVRLVMERLFPVRKGRAVTIPGFPPVRTIEDVPVAHTALLAAVTSGVVSPEEAAPMSAMLSAFVSTIDAVALKARLDELEARIAESDRLSRRHAGAGEPESFTFGLDTPDGP